MNKPRYLATVLKTGGMSELIMHWANITEMIPSQHTHIQDKTTTSLKKRCISPNCQYILNTIKKLLRASYHCFTAQFWDLVHLKNKPVILRHLVDMWFIHLGLCPRWISHISPRGRKITVTNSARFELFVVAPKITRANDYNIIHTPVTQDVQILTFVH